jgi:double-stranded RNA-binding protein Staufen
LLSEGTSPTAEAITKTPTTSTAAAPSGETGRIKDQLMYLAQLLNFDVSFFTSSSIVHSKFISFLLFFLKIQVMFSDFPKGNHGEYLTLVTLSTEPPQLCHGSGSSPMESQDEAARVALEMLSKIGLDNVKSSKSSDKKPKPILTNGVKN